MTPIAVSSVIAISPAADLELVKRYWAAQWSVFRPATIAGQGSEKQPYERFCATIPVTGVTRLSRCRHAGCHAQTPLGLIAKRLLL